ncbi:hypothetical protein BJX96DRAFT_111041 [Aspergillus floccosus]
MSKRPNDGTLSAPPPSKRSRVTRAGNRTADRLSSLSDEILLHILSYLPIPSLLVCQSVSRRFHILAGDSELWKRKYYSRWVRPRARRLANGKRASSLRPKFQYSPKVSTWLDHSHLAKEGSATNWKRQYRLRHNWSRGACRVSEVAFPQPPRSPLLVDFCAGYVFTADSDHGLRAWNSGDPKSCLATAPFDGPGPQSANVPTALAASRCPQRDLVYVAVGFESGCFSIYHLDSNTSQLKTHSSHGDSSGGAITAIALSFPYILMVSKHKDLSLYRVPANDDASDTSEPPQKAHRLASLTGESILTPMSLSIRVTGGEIISSVVFSFFHIGCGWSLGIQEVHFDQRGEQIASRLTTTVDSQYGLMSATPPTESTAESLISRRQNSTSIEPSISHHEPPTSVSYSHPYLLSSHRDNTLTVYLVVSTADGLYVKGAQRLWGHTSSVSTVQVSDRGKAISVSAQGGEIRIWELETLISLFGTARAFREEKSIQVSPENEKHGQRESLTLLSVAPLCETGENRSPSEASCQECQKRGCIGFDDERVLLIRENQLGTRFLELYDFT